MADESFVSTSRLAQSLNIEIRQLFQMLLKQHWIERQGDEWQLTALGELEGGRYQQSDKFGQYIVWPSELTHHPLFNNEPDRISATRLGEVFGLNAFMMNHLLAHLGLIDKSAEGWLITDLGKQQGGVQRSGKYGFFVVWPNTIQHYTPLKAAVDNVKGVDLSPCLDGLTVSSAGEKQINNWLYLHGLNRAWRYAIPASAYQCHFYLPHKKVFIDYWGFDLSTGSLSDKLKKQAFYQANGLHAIEISDDDLSDLNTVLGEKLLSFGIKLYNDTP